MYQYATLQRQRQRATAVDFCRLIYQPCRAGSGCRRIRKATRRRHLQNVCPLDAQAPNALQRRPEIDGFSVADHAWRRRRRSRGKQLNIFQFPLPAPHNGHGRTCSEMHWCATRRIIANTLPAGIERSIFRLHFSPSGFCILEPIVRKPAYIDHCLNLYRLMLLINCYRLLPSWGSAMQSMLFMRLPVSRITAKRSGCPTKCLPILLCMLLNRARWLYATKGRWSSQLLGRLWNIVQNWISHGHQRLPKILRVFTHNLSNWCSYCQILRNIYDKW